MISVRPSPVPSPLPSASAPLKFNAAPATSFPAVSTPTPTHVLAVRDACHSAAADAAELITEAYILMGVAPSRLPSPSTSNPHRQLRTRADKLRARYAGLMQQRVREMHRDVDELHALEEAGADCTALLDKTRELVMKIEAHECVWAAYCEELSELWQEEEL